MTRDVITTAPTSMLGIDIGITDDFTVASRPATVGCLHMKTGKSDDARRHAAKEIVQLAIQENAWIAVEQWNMRGQMQQTHMKLSPLQSILRHEAARMNVGYIEIDRKYTSRTCHKCGSVHASKKEYEIFRSGKDISCPDCGYIGDADENAAINIANRGWNKYNDLR